MKGNCIVVNPDAEGIFTEGYVASSLTFYPGMVVQRDPTVALIGGRFTYKIAGRGADGQRPAGAYWVVTGRLEQMRGRSLTDAIAAGQHTELYSPEAGDELNLLLEDQAGTGDAHAAGEVLIVDDTTAKLIATTGSPQTEVAQLLEAVAAPTGDTLAWCQWSGH